MEIIKYDESLFNELKSLRLSLEKYDVSLDHSLIYVGEEIFNTLMKGKLDLITKKLEKNTFAYLIKENATYIGFVLFTYVKNSNIFKEHVFVESIYVKDQYRGNGFGKQLLEIVEKFAVEKNINIQLLCYSNNPVCDLYRKGGFENLAIMMIKRVNKE